MGCCSLRCVLLTVISLQLVSTLERQIFDFLGYMWLPILLNFVHAVFTIVGFFGAYQNRRPYLITYLVWCILWISWSSFVICLYMEVGSLTEEVDILSLGTGSYSWWQTHGFGCRPIFSTNGTLLSQNDTDLTDHDAHSAILYRPLKPIRVEDCLLEHRYVEALHAVIQIALIVLAFPLAVWLVRHLSDDDDGFHFIGGFGQGNACDQVSPSPCPPHYRIHARTPTQPQLERSWWPPTTTTTIDASEADVWRTSDVINGYANLVRSGNYPSGVKGSSRAESIYSIQYSTNVTTDGMRRTSTPEMTTLSRDHLNQQYESFNEPMTPRRVKRRSLTRNSGRSSRGSKRNGNAAAAAARAGNRSSTRSTRSARARRMAERSVQQPTYRNPVNRLMSMDPALDSSTSNDEAYRHMNNLTFHGHVNPTYASSRPGSVTSFSTAAGANTMPLMPMPPITSSMYGFERDTPTPPPPPPPLHSAVSGLAHGNGLSSFDHRPKSAMSAYSNYHAHRQPYGVINSLYSARNGVGARGQVPKREDAPNFDPGGGNGSCLLPLPMDSNSTTNSSVQAIAYPQAVPPPPVRPSSRVGNLNHNHRPYLFAVNSETVI